MARMIVLTRDNIFRFYFSSNEYLLLGLEMDGKLERDEEGNFLPVFIHIPFAKRREIGSGDIQQVIRRLEGLHIPYVISKKILRYITEREQEEHRN